MAFPNQRNGTEKLQDNVGYMQRFFPSYGETGISRPEELQLHEIEKIKQDANALKRLVKSYIMMLNFYELELIDKGTGEVSRSKNWEERFLNLNVPGSKNNRRISRILKCLGEFGYEHYKVSLIKRLLYEILVEGTLEHCLQSCFHYWIEVVKDSTEREELRQYAANELVRNETGKH